MEDVVSRSTRRRIGVSKLAAAGFFALAAFAFAPAPASAQGCSANFNCEFGTSPQCWFSILSGGKLRTFVVRAGARKTIYGLRRGDQFCVSTRGAPNPYNCANKRINMNCGY